MSGWWLASYLMLWVTTIALAVVVVALARQIGTLHLRLGPRGALEMDDEGPPLGEAPPPLVLAATDGTAVTIGGHSSGQLVMFVSPGCRVCEIVLPSLDVVAMGAGLSPVLVTDLDDEETALAYSAAPVDAPVVAGKEAASTYNVPGTPYVVILDQKGIVRAKGTVNNLEQVEGLVDTAMDRVTGDG